MKESPILQGRLAIESETPLYLQLVSIFKRCIASGALKASDLIPTELELSEYFKISRSTVRQALGALEEEELIARRRGKGSFVTIPKLRRKLDNLYSFSKEMRAMGLEPKSRMIAFQIIKATPELIKVLQLSDGENVYKIIRVRLANNEPQLVETTYVPVRFYSELTEKHLEQGSLYTILTEQAGIEPYFAKESYEPIILKKSEAALLNCKPGSTGFFIQRKSLTESGEPFEFTQSIMRGDRTRFEINLHRDGVSISRNFDSNSFASIRPEF